VVSTLHFTRCSLTHAGVSSTIIEELTNHCKTSPSLAVAYFYFEFDKDIHPQAVLRSLIKQLSLSFSSTPDPLEKLFSENADGHRSPTSEQLMSTVKSFIRSFENVYIIFDALDECQHRREFLGLLKQFHGWALGPLHLLATSRREQDIATVLETLVSHDIHMDETLVDEDIRLHVSRRLGRDEEFRKVPEKERKTMENALAKGAGGM
jgi:hypothetical protein